MELINRINDVLEGMALVYNPSKSRRYNLQQLFNDRSDFVFIGAGNFCTAYLHVETDTIVKFIPQCYENINEKNGPNKVNISDSSWLCSDTERMVEYLRDCMEMQKEWMPKVHSMFSFQYEYDFDQQPGRWEISEYERRSAKPRRRGTKVLKPQSRLVQNLFRCTVVITERLKPIVTKDGDFVTEELRQQYKSIERALPTRHDIVARRYIKPAYAWRQFLKRCNQRTTSDQFAREVRKYIFSIAQRTSTDRINIDISNENIMMRGDQIVINDPIY